MPADIRQATRDDLSAILQLIFADSLTGLDLPVGQEPAAPYLRAFEEIQADPNNEYWVLEEEGGPIVGCFQLTYSPGLAYRGGWRATVETVRIAANRRGEGLGRQMMEWAVERARQRGCALFQLATNKQRSDARRFYESLGLVASHQGMKLRL